MLLYKIKILYRELIDFKIMKKEIGCMKKIIILIILLVNVISCSELSEMEARSQQIRRERGRECMYNYKGELQGCNYIR